MVIFRNQKGSASKRVWETLLQRLLLIFLKIRGTLIYMLITLQGVNSQCVTAYRGWSEVSYLKCNGSHVLLCFCVSCGTVNTHYFPIHYLPAGLRNDVVIFVMTQELNVGMYLVRSSVKKSAVPARLAGKLLYSGAQYLGVLSVGTCLISPSWSVEF